MSVQCSQASTLQSHKQIQGNRWLQLSHQSVCYNSTFIPAQWANRSWLACMPLRRWRWQLMRSGGIPRSFYSIWAEDCTVSSSRIFIHIITRIQTWHDYKVSCFASWRYCFTSSQTIKAKYWLPERRNVRDTKRKQQKETTNMVHGPPTPLCHKICWT